MNPILKSQPWWEPQFGWRIHLSLDKYFCLAWNRYTDEVAAWPALIPDLYPETKEGNWLPLVSDALFHGQNPIPTP